MSDIYKINTDSTIYRNSYIVAMLLGKIIVEEERNKKIEFENEKDIIDEMFNLPFEKAIKQLLDRKIISYEELEKISKESVSNYFWIKKATDLEITSRIQKKLVKSLENGETYRQFKKNLNIDEMGLGTNGSYWEGAFRTNIAIAQAKGQLDAQIEGIEYGYKYGLFDAILDGRETHTCHDLDGKVMLLEKWIEKGLYPPLHYRCRSRIIALDEEDVKAMGLTVEQDVKGKAQGNFGSFGDSVKRLKELVREKEKRVKKNKKEIEKRELKNKENGGIIDYKEVDEKIEKELQKRSNKIWNKKLLGSEQNAIKEYSGPYYTQINTYFRKLIDEKDIDSHLIQTIKELDRSLSNNILGDNLILYRGVSVEEFNAWKNTDTIETYKSTSISESIFKYFGDGHKIIIKASKDTKGFYLGKYSEFSSEKEFLLHRGQKYKIIKIDENIMEVEFYG